jgi:hypothetical protein
MGMFAKTAIIEHHLPTKENKLPFSVSVYSKQMKVCHFPNAGLPFSKCSRQMEVAVSISSVFPNSGTKETWRHSDVEIETWKHGDMETWKHGDIETWRPGNMETWRQVGLEAWRHGDMDMEISKRKLKPL